MLLSRGNAINIIMDNVFKLYVLTIASEFRLCHPVDVTGQALVFGLLLMQLTD